MLLLDTSSNCLFAYNNTARQVWDLIGAARSVEEVVCGFAAAWGIPASNVKGDVSSILTEWSRLGLLIGGGPDPEPAQVASVAPTHRDIGSPPSWTLEWSSSVRGVVIQFAVEGSLASTIYDMFEHLEAVGAPPEGRFEVRNFPDGLVLIENGVQRISSRNPAQVVGALWQALLERIHPNVRWRALIHGGAVGRNGNAIGICGPSGSGKTTLIAALISREFDYLADDMIALSSPLGAIVPLPVPLSVKPGSLSVLSAYQPGLARARRYRTKGVEARLLTPPLDAWDLEPVPMRSLVFPRFIVGALPEVQRISPFSAVERLLAERIWLGDPITEERVADFLNWLGETTTYEISYGDLDDGVRLIEAISK